MTVVAETELGWLLDHRTFWINCLQGCQTSDAQKAADIKNEATKDKLTVTSKAVKCESIEPQPTMFSGLMDSVNPVCCYFPQKELFSIYNPYQMDSQFEKQSVMAKTTVENCLTVGKEPLRQCVDDCSSQQSKTEKKRKRKQRQRAEENSYNDDNIKKIADHLSKSLVSLVKLGHLNGHLSETSMLPVNNNKEARQLALQDVTDMNISVEPLQETDHTKLTPAHILPGQNYSFSELCHTLYRHDGDSLAVLHCDSNQYLIPSQSLFYLSQAEDIASFVTSLDSKKFDLIVMDPPWENKSVKRKKQYYTLPNWDLCDLPVPKLSNDNCLVIVWVTNKQKHQDYIRQVLFPKWSVKYLVHWYWLKITLGGEPVIDLMSHGKKPYESLIIGRFSSQKHTEKTGQPTSYDPPADRVIISVPCILHSKKPPLEAVVKKYCVANPQCLELFARNLTAGWTSWGNEVLRHQHMKFYTTENL